MCVALPARITWIGTPKAGSIPARARSSAGESAVDLVLTPSATVGDYVVVHSGYSIRTVTSAEVEATRSVVGAEVIPGSFETAPGSGSAASPAPFGDLPPP